MALQLAASLGAKALRPGWGCQLGIVRHGHAPLGFYADPVMQAGSGRSCGYCGNADNPLTREHVWPRWLSGFFGEQVEPHVSAEEDEVLHVWSAKLATQTVKRVCRACNNGWMADLENQARAPLTAVLDAQAMTLVPSEQGALARWALKTATACDLCNPQPAAPQAFRTELVGGGDPPDGIVVFIARYTGQRHPLLSGGWTRQVRIAVGGRPSMVHMMQLTVAIGSVVFGVFGHGLAGTVDLRPVGWKAKYAQVVWPIAAPVRWPPRVSLDDDDLRRFAREL
jgi:hypothetical protein